MSVNDASYSEVGGVVWEDKEDYIHIIVGERGFEGRSMGNEGDVIEGILNERGAETIVPKVGRYLGSPRVERLILGTDMAEAEE
eukprot:g14665.t1